MNKKLESIFQRELIKEIEATYDGCLVLKNDPDYIQGIPDLLVLYNDRWAALECKRGSNSAKRPNQSYYVDKMNQMSYAAFICPENKEEVLRGLQQAFTTPRG